MPIVTGTFTPVLTRGSSRSSAPQLPVATIKQLQGELSAVGLAVTRAEAGTTPQFGQDTSAQLKAFQLRYGLEASGDLSPTSGGVLYLAALVAAEGDRAKLQAALKDAVGKVPNSPEYNYWLARYAIMAGDYATAKTIAQPFPNAAGLTANLGGIIVVGLQPRQPKIPHPENFYSYHDDLMDQQVLDKLRSDVQALNPQDYRTYLSNLGVTSVVDGPAFNAAIAAGGAALAAISAWQNANRHAANREFALAMQSYEECQSSVADYCAASISASLPGDTATQRIQAFLIRMQHEDTYSAFWGVLRWRRILLSLAELAQDDREQTIGTDGSFSSAAAFLTAFTYIPPDNYNSPVFAKTATNQMTRLDPLLVVMATLWAPMAIGELNCQLRQFDAAIQGFTDILGAQAAVDVSFRYFCEFIEIPFIRLLTLGALMDKADAEYKTGATVDATTFPDAPTYRGLLAAQTYEQVMSKITEDGQYAANVTQGRDTLVASAKQFIQNNDTTSLAFRSLGKGITIPTIAALKYPLPGLDRTLAPHQPMAAITAPDGRTTNPRVYAIGLQATAKLQQIKAGFNYLGYPADYVPPWRFSFLLDRARYFAEHAKNAQRDYLNFLSNAEHEEFQEQSVAQNVEMEKMNVRMETTKVEIANTQVAAAKAAADNAALHASNVSAQASEFVDLSLQQDDADAWSGIESMFGDEVKMGEGFATGNPGDVISGGVGIVDTARSVSLKQAERAYERDNMQSAVEEANAAAAAALIQVNIASSSLEVAGLELQAAIMRHEFAVENLDYLRNQTLNSEQWFRLANAIRGVSDSYLHDAMELAFLAQQAYEFESDRTIDVIRFDYDLSDVGSMLAADFLVRDLDTLEQDLIVSQQARQQQVRYVLSMAREFPETLRRLAETGEVTFGLRLEQLERHFPGLFRLRLSSVDVQPVALMDPTRVSVELTHLGAGMIRFKAQPGTSPLNSTDLPAGDDWLGTAGAPWPVRIQISGPDTTVFTGLSRQDIASVSTTTANERGAFEGLPGASLWRIDMSAKENQVVPGTLTDVVITFVLSGYYDAELNDAVTAAAASARVFATTSYISARNTLPDAYYSLAHYGQLDWDISDRMLTLNGTPNELRNLGIMLPLVPDGPEIGRCYCHYPIQIQVASGTVNVLTVLPQFTTTPNGLTLNCAFTGPAGTQVNWDFGDGTPLAQGSSAAHTYARPGRYEVMTRLVLGSTLVEYRSAVVVSANHSAAAPLAVTPTFSASAAASDGTVTLTVSTSGGAQDVSLDCSAGTVRARSDSGPAILKLKPRTYILDFLAMRKLSARFYGKQRYLPAVPIALNRGRIATNRTFDATTGSETTTSLNAFGTQLFKNGNVAVTLSPVDRWTLELPLADNPWFATVSPSDVAEFDGGELSDAILTLEFLGPQ